MKKLLIVLFALVLLLPFKTCAVEASVETQMEAVIAMAEAYKVQSEKLEVHYDSYRKQLYATPEDATEQHIVYTVCSGITFQSYYQALGIKLPDTTETLLEYAKDNKGTDYVLDYYTRAELDALGSNKTEIGQAILDKWTPIARPGDIIIQTGHAMMVHSVDTSSGGIGIQTIEAALGGRYNYEEHKDVVEGVSTIQYRTLKNKIGAVVDSGTEELALIRPTKDGNKYLKQSGSSGNRTYTEETYSGITAAAADRMRYRGIDIEKTIEIKDNTSQNLLAGLNETIFYTIVIINQGSSNYNSLRVTENIPSFLEVATSGGGTVNGKTITWTIDSLPVGEYRTIRYSVKVPNDPSLLGKTFVSTGSVNNIKTARIETIIGTKYSAADTNKLRLAFDELKNNDSTERRFINDIYLKAFNLDLGVSNLSNLDIMEYDPSIKDSGKDVLAVRKTKLKDSSVSKYVFQNFYGPRLFGGVKTSVNSNRDCPDSNLVRIMLSWNIYVENELNDRARNVFPSMLLDGDIILMYTNDENIADDSSSCPTQTLENRSYIYLNEKLIRKKSKTEFEEISGDDLYAFLNNLVGHNYVMLRPSNERVGLPASNVPDNGDQNDDSNQGGEDIKNDSVIKNPNTNTDSFLYSLIVILTIFTAGYISIRNK